MKLILYSVCFYGIEMSLLSIIKSLHITAVSGGANFSLLTNFFVHISLSLNENLTAEKHANDTFFKYFIGCTAS